MGCCSDAVVQIAGAAAAVVAALPEIVRGARVADEVYQQRVTICRACSEYQDGWCGPMLRKTQRTCGCAIIAKAQLPSQQCPQGKWVATKTPG